MSVEVVEKIIPPNVILAAKRGFVRTTTQAYATALAGGISTSVILSVMTGGASWLEYAVTWLVAILSPLLAGLASYLSIVGDGIPEAYTGQLVQAPYLEPSTGFQQELPLDQLTETDNT